MNKVGLIDARPVKDVVRFDIATSLLMITLVVRGPVSVPPLPGFAFLCLTCVSVVDKVCISFDIKCASMSTLLNAHLLL